MSAGLSRREREIIEILHRMGKATAGEVHEAMADAPTYSAVRSTLRILEEKGHARHEIDGKRYVYLAAEASHVAAKSALDQVVTTFFAGSLEGVVRTFLAGHDQPISAEELSRISKLIEEAKDKEGK